RMRFIMVISTSKASVPNCCPPIECRLPQTLIGVCFVRAVFRIERKSCAVFGVKTAATDVRLSCEGISLTKISSPDGFGALNAERFCALPAVKLTFGIAAKTQAPLINSRKSLREIGIPPPFQTVERGEEVWSTAFMRKRLPPDPSASRRY